MKYTNVFLLVLFFLNSLTGQGVEWTAGSWQEIIEKANATDKVIFVDVYTDWCVPCKKMDKSVFPDKTLGEYFNQSFISIKVNADDGGPGTTLAKEYDVGAYPTLLFVDGKGNLLTSFVGVQTVATLLDLARKTSDLYDQYDFLEKVKANVYGTYSFEQLSSILGITQIHSFPGKEHLAMTYLDQVRMISENDLRLVMGEISRMNLQYLRRLVPMTASLSYSEIYLRRNKREWMTWKSDSERAVHDLLKKYKNENNVDLFGQTLEILKDFSGMKPHKVDNFYLDFYKHNDLDQYRTFATYLIEEYIIPIHPETLKEADEKKFQRLHEEIMKDMKAASETNQTMFIENQKTSMTPTIDSLSEIYTMSKSIADQLYEISSDFFAFYDDESSKRKAAFWASLCHLYYPYDWKYYDNHIYILESTGQINEAKEVRQKASNQPWYQEMIRVSSF